MFGWFVPRSTFQKKYFCPMSKIFLDSPTLQKGSFNGLKNKTKLIIVCKNIYVDEQRNRCQMLRCWIFFGKWHRDGVTNLLSLSFYDFKLYCFDCAPHSARHANGHDYCRFSVLSTWTLISFAVISLAFAVAICTSF